VIEKSEPDDNSPDTPSPGEFPLQSPESRAAARRLVESGGTPHIDSHLVKCGEKSEKFPSGAPVRVESVRAVVSCFEKENVTYTLLAGETSEAFERRVWNDLPVAGPLHVVTFSPADDPPDQAA
jgi:hypothetical protein